MRDPGNLTLADAADAIRDRDLSPVDLVNQQLAVIEACNPLLNAYVTVMAEQAMHDAQRAEAEIAAGRYRGPLHGIPLSLKDLIDTAGTPTTASSPILRDVIPERDATVTTRLREAGAIIIAKANMLEFAYGEVHPEFGPSRNPWNLDYGTSGSSSGSAAAVAAGLDFGSLGSDTGGSIRLPSAYCGIVGLKPTYGLVSRMGVVPLAWTLDHVGPMTRTVRDNAILLQAIAGHDAMDPASASVPIPDYQQRIGQPTAGITVGVVQAADDDEVQPAVRRETDYALRALEEAGYTTVPVAMPHPVQAARALLALLYVEASTFHEPWLRSHREQYSQNTLDRLDLGALLPGTVYVRAQRVRRLVSEAYRQLFAQLDLLAMPIAPVSSYRLEDTPDDPVLETGDRFKALCRFSGPFNLTGLPAIGVPCGFDDAGLPVGLQMVARPFAEPVLYQAAAALEQQVGRFGKVVAV